MKLTPEQYELISKHGGKVYRSYALPTHTNRTVSWSNPDDQFVVTLDKITLEMTGQYYDWNEEEEDWVDTEVMTDKDLSERINNREFIVV